MTDSVAQAEADRFFSHKDRLTSHPEDISDSDDHSDVNEKKTHIEPYHSDPPDDEDTLHSMSATTTTTATCHIPHHVFDANTGPKGVIADAQAFSRAKKKSFRNTLFNITNGSYFHTSSKPHPTKLSSVGTDSSEKSQSDLDDDEDSEFMEQWRQSRLKEMRAGSSYHQQRRHSPSKRIWGSFREVDANGYLDAVEKTVSDAVVVVCLFDPQVGCASSLLNQEHFC